MKEVAFAGANAAFTFVWMSVLHSIQYLWITDYYVRKERSSGSTPGFLLKSLLAGAALYGLPLLLLSPAALGTLPYDAGLYVLVAGARCGMILWDFVQRLYADLELECRLKYLCPGSGCPRARWATMSA